jgi:phosphoglycerate dehydrogenase-like enzyme
LSGRPHNLHFSRDEASAMADLREAQILLTYRQRFVEALVHAAPNLRWVHVGDAGVEQCFFPAFLERGAVLTNSSGIHGQYMSEWTLAMLLYISQRLAEVEAWRADHDWKRHKDPIVTSRFLIEGKKALIVGYGEIGKAVAQKLLALGVACEGIVSRFRPAAIPLHTTRKLPEILRYFDIVVIATPLTPETENLFNRDMLQRMKPGSILVNLARGKVTDEAALMEVLRNGPLAYAALDVFAEEPLPAESPLFAIPNLVMTPHISGNFPEYTQRVHDLFLQNLERFANGKPLLHVVDRAKGY